MTFSERVEMRAKLLAGKHGDPIEDHVWKSYGDEQKYWISLASGQIILEYAAANPIAMERLIEGTAGVIEFIPDDDPRFFAQCEECCHNTELKRLDTPAGEKYMDELIEKACLAYVNVDDDFSTYSPSAQEDVRRYMRAAIHAINSSGTHVVVPVEPSDEMRLEGFRSLVNKIQETTERGRKEIREKYKDEPRAMQFFEDSRIGALMRNSDESNAVYQAMLAARPEA